MDVLADLLDGPRARGAFLLRATMRSPWATRIQDRAPLSLCVMVNEDSWLWGDTRAPLKLPQGHVAVIKGPEPYTVAGRPDHPVRVIIHPGQQCAAPDGTSLTELTDLGTRAWGDRGGSAVMLIGTYPLRGAVTGRLLSALPHVLTLPLEGSAVPLAALLEEEVGRDAPGQDVVLDRLLDLLLVAVLRTWFDRPDAEAPGWFRAHGDPVVGPALRILHENPARPWTVTELARETGTSRAAFTRRFGRLVGEPPMAYLTGLRLALAADLLRETDATLDAVARRVGYGTSFALSTAFKREHGMSPQRFRSGARTPAFSTG